MMVSAVDCSEMYISAWRNVNRLILGRLLMFTTYSGQQRSMSRRRGRYIFADCLLTAAFWVSASNAVERVIVAGCLGLVGESIRQIAFT